MKHKFNYEMFKATIWDILEVIDIKFKYTCRVVHLVINQAIYIYEIEQSITA